MNSFISFTFVSLSIFVSCISSAPLSEGRDWMDRCDINEMRKTSTTTTTTTKAPHMVNGIPSIYLQGGFVRVNDGPGVFVEDDDNTVMKNLLQKFMKDAYIRGQNLESYLHSGSNDYVVESNTENESIN